MNSCRGTGSPKKPETAPKPDGYRIAPHQLKQNIDADLLRGGIYFSNLVREKPRNHLDLLTNLELN